MKTPSPAWNDLCENEFSMMTLARMVGMNVPEIRLLDVDGIANLPDGLGEMTGQAFAIRRFDRSDDGTLVHIEDFAQIFEIFPDEKYNGSFSDVARVIASECDQEDIEEFIRRLTFNLIIGQRRHASKELVAHLSRQAKAVARPGLRLCLNRTPYTERGHGN